MDNTYPNPESTKHPQLETKTVLLRLAIIVLVLFTTHVLSLWLHPLGAHRFFWNLVLGAVSFWVAVRLLIPRPKGDA
jgi:hypothetical protein